MTKLGNRAGEHCVWDSLGYIELNLGDFAKAAGHFEFALGLCRNHGSRVQEAEILNHLGDAREAAGELPQARQAWEQAVVLYDGIQNSDADKVRGKLARVMLPARSEPAVRQAAPHVRDKNDLSLSPGAEG
jgi:tetratricopeptide (TPR) repeat protein